MKNKKIAVLAAAAAIVLLVACGTGKDQDVISGEMVAPEVSSQDLLVSSLEYLLLDGGEEDVSDEEPDTPDEEQNLSVQEAQSVQAVIYYGDGGSVALKQETIEVESLTPDELISALARHNIVSLDTKVLSSSCSKERRKRTAQRRCISICPKRRENICEPCPRRRSALL